MADSGKNVGGRPRKSFDFGGLEFGVGKPIKVQMGDRKAVEELCQGQIEELQNDFSEMKADQKVILTCLRTEIQRESAERGKVDKQLLENFEKAQYRVRQICKDQSGILAMLMKQFELFSALERPAEDDPIYTPVHLHICNEPPPEAIVETRFKLDEDDIEPQRD